MEFKARFLLATSLLLLPCISTQTTDEPARRRKQNIIVVGDPVDIPVSTVTEYINMDINIINLCDLLDPIYFLPETYQFEKVQCDWKHQLYIESLSQFCPKPNTPFSSTASGREKPFAPVIPGNTINSATDHRNTIVKDVNALYASMAELKPKFEVAYNLTADVVSTVTKEIIQGVYINKRTAYEWRHGKLNPDFFDRLEVQAQCGPNCPFHLGKPVFCRMHPDEKSLQIEIIMPIINTNYAILRAQSYNVMTEAEDNETCTSRYVGPSLVVVSGSHNCVMEVNSDELLGKSVFSIFSESCKTALDVDDTDNVRKISCEPSQPNDHLKFFKTLNGRNYTYFYCPGSNVEHLCENKLNRLPKIADAAVKGTLYPATTVNTNERPLTPMMSFTANRILVPGGHR